MSMQQFFSRLLTRRLLAVAGQTLLVHDYLLTFSLEVDCIWHARWSAVKIIFLFNRYGNLIGQSIYLLEELGILSHGSQKFCTHYQWIVALYGVLSEESIHALVLLRAWAIWGCKYHVAVVLISAYILYLSAIVGLSIYMLVVSTNQNPQFIDLADTNVCIIQASFGSYTSWVLPLISFMLDSTVFFMLAYFLGKLFKETQHFRHSPVLRVLAMDAALYFVASTIVGTVGILSQTIYLHDPLNMLMVVCLPLVTVAGQRVVLNLRSLKPRPRMAQVVETIDTGPSPLWSRHRELEGNQEAETASAIELFVMKEP